MKGRPRKPTAVKALQGTLYKHRMNPLEPAPGVEVPPMPKEFRGREAGREYQRLTRELKHMRTVAKADRGVLVAWSVAWENMMASYAQCADVGLVIRGANKGLMLNPFLLSLSMAMKQIRALAPELGITPASRSRVNAVPAPKERSLADDLLDVSPDGDLAFDRPEPRGRTLQ